MILLRFVWIGLCGLCVVKQNLPGLKKMETSHFIGDAALVGGSRHHTLLPWEQSEQQCHSLINDSRCFSTGLWWHHQYQYHRCSDREYGIIFKWLWKTVHLFPFISRKQACGQEDIIQSSSGWAFFSGFKAFSKATNVILSSNYMTYIKEPN